MEDPQSALKARDLDGDFRTVGVESFPQAQTADDGYDHDTYQTQMMSTNPEAFRGMEMKLYSPHTIPLSAETSNRFDYPEHPIPTRSETPSSLWKSLTPTPPSQSELSFPRCVVKFPLFCSDDE